MTDKDKIPTLKEALRGTVPDSDKEKSKAEEPEEFPPPPGDWTTHLYTRLILLLVLLGLIVIGIFRGEEAWEFIMAHPFGAGVTLIIVVVFAVIVLVAYWRSRAMGRREDRYWKTD